MTKKNKKVYVANGNTHYVYDVDSLKKGGDIPESTFNISLPDGRLRFSTYANDGYILGALDNKRFGIFNINNEKLLSKYEYSGGLLVEQGSFLNHPSEMKAVYLQNYSAAMALLEYSSNDIEMQENIWWKTNNKQEKLSNGNLSIVAGPNQRLGFLDSTVSDKYIYTLYSGKPIGYGDKLAYLSKTVFDKLIV